VYLFNKQLKWVRVMTHLLSLAYKSPINLPSECFRDMALLIQHCGKDIISRF